MVFQQAFDALAFAIEVQRSLVHCSWDESLLRHPAARPVLAGLRSVLMGQAPVVQCWGLCLGLARFGFGVPKGLG